MTPKVEVVRDKSMVLKPQDYLVIDTETDGTSVKMGYTPILDRLILVSISDGKRRQIIPMELVRSCLADLLKDESLPKVFHNATYDLHVLANIGLDFAGPIFDTMVMAWLLDSNDTSASLDSLASRYLSEGKRSFGKVFDDKKNPFLSNLELSFEYASHDAWLTAKLYELLERELKNRKWIFRQGKNLYDYYLEFESPFTKVLFNMERRGIRIDLNYVNEIEAKITKRLEEIEMEVNLMAKRPINLNSPVQLSKLLFNDLGLPPVKRTNSGSYSTDVSVLETLAAQGVTIAKVLLEYRSLGTLYKTFVKGIKKRVPLTGGRLHPTFNQAGTRTGRLSGSSPNTQNFPRPDNDPFKIRKVFIASDGYALVDSDYSQAEVRLIAHLSADEALIRSITGSDDVYTAIAKDIFNVPEEEVTKRIRNIVKRLVLAVNYGMSPQTLAESLTKGGIPTTVNEAKDLLDRYFKTYRGLGDYIKFIPGVVKKNNGYFFTLLGRPRYIPEILSNSYRSRSLGERQAVNTGPQGGVADLLRVAMVLIESDEELSELGCRMLLQIHDELLFECPEENKEKVVDRVKDIMLNCFPKVGLNLAVPMKVDISTGKTWAEAKE